MSRKMIREDAVTSFFLRVSAAEGGCREWTGPRFAHGYGKFGGGSGLSNYAHRASWEIHNGPIPRGMFVLHKCDNRVCVNPEHLFLGTQMDNMADMRRKGRAACVGPAGERARSAKLTERQVRDIRSDYRSGSVIAAEYGVQRSAINKVRRGDTWRHVQ